MKSLYQKIKKKQHLLVFLSIVVIVVNILFRIYPQKDIYAQKYDPTYWKQRYFKSQWVVNPPIESIGDDGLYSYEGWEQVNGRDPTLLNAEVPPFGKYLIGYSILLFGNRNLFGLLTGITALLSIYLLNMELFKNRLVSIIPVVFFSFEPLFYTQLFAPFLDLLYLTTFCLSMFFFLKRNFLLSGIFLGLMMSTKASLATFCLVVASYLIYLVILKQFKDYKNYILLALFAIFAFTLTYIRYFVLGHSPREFLGVQKYAFLFYAGGAKGNVINVWEMLLFGNWHTWWGVTTRVQEWLITWPLLLFLSFLFLIVIVFTKKTTLKMSLIFIWIVVYFLFLMVVPVWPRYLLLVIPFMYNLVIWLLLFSRSTKSRLLLF